MVLVVKGEGGRKVRSGWEERGERGIFGSVMEGDVPMWINRRQLLKAIPAIPAVLAGCDGSQGKESGAEPTPGRPAEPEPWQPGGEEDAVAFAWGVQAGDPGPGSVIISVRSVPTELELVLVQAFDGGWVEVRREVIARTEETAQVEITGLNADTAYQYAVYDAVTGKRSLPGRFRTAVDAQGFRRLSFGITSCFGGNEPWPSAGYAADERFDAFFLLGDTVYADGAVSLEDYREFWRHALSVEGLRALTASTGIVAAWDDHEVGNNWSRDSLADGQFEDALQAYRESLPQGTGPGGGIWRLLSWGTLADIIVLDCRSERSGDQYISVEQIEWLKTTLKNSAARFKLILNSVPINDYSDMFGEAFVQDRWQGYPAQRAEILKFVADNAVPGVLWLAGDVHHAMVCSVDVPGSGGPGEAQWEVACGPSGSTLNVAAELYNDTTGHYPVLFAAYNYVRLGLDPGTGEATITFVGDDGAEIDSMTLAL